MTPDGIADPQATAASPVSLPRRTAAPIAYFGTSVTVQRDGYRPRLHAALCERWHRPHRAIFAGIGGVGSISGLFLIDDLVLRHGPGLCFVEFATTDILGLTPRRLLRPVLEEIVCRLRDHDCEPCFVLLGRSDRGRHDRDAVLAAYREVADLHDVLCVDVADELERGEDMLRDVVHTTPRGAALIAARVADALGPAGPPPARPARTRAHEPSFANVTVVPAAPEQLRDRSEFTAGVLRELYPYVRVRAPNAFEAPIAGELIGLVVVVGPSSGAVRIRVDDGPAERAVLWDEWCSYERLSTVVLRDRHRAGGRVTIEPVVEELDYAGARRPVADPDAIVQDLRLVGYMVRG